MGFERITVNPQQMGGVPCILSLRIPVATVVGLVAQGMAEAEILAEYPDLELDDIRQALAFAAAAVDERQLPLLSGDLRLLYSDSRGRLAGPLRSRRSVHRLSM